MIQQKRVEQKKKNGLYLKQYGMRLKNEYDCLLGRKTDANTQIWQ